LRAAAAVEFRRVDQRHAERKARAQRLFLLRLRTPSLSEPRGALTERRDDSAVAEFHGSARSARGRLGPRRRSRHRRAHGADDRRQAERREISVKLTTVKQYRLLFRWPSKHRHISVQVNTQE